MWHSIDSRHRLPPVAAPTLVTLAILGFLLVGLGTTATAVWSLRSTPFTPDGRTTLEQAPLSAGAESAILNETASAAPATEAIGGVAGLEGVLPGAANPALGGAGPQSPVRRTRTLPPRTHPDRCSGMVTSRAATRPARRPQRSVWVLACPGYWVNRWWSRRERRRWFRHAHCDRATGRPALGRRRGSGSFIRAASMSALASGGTSVDVPIPVEVPAVPPAPDLGDLPGSADSSASDAHHRSRRANWENKVNVTSGVGQSREAALVALLTAVALGTGAMVA